MKIRRDKIREALGSTKSWPKMKRRIAALTNAELAEAGRLERLGQRRENMLKALHAEHRLRTGEGHQALRMETNL